MFPLILLLAMKMLHGVTGIKSPKNITQIPPIIEEDNLSKSDDVGVR